MADLIDRHAAIDALARAAREKFNLSDEFNHYLAGLIDGENAIRQLPSAQPEVLAHGEGELIAQPEPHWIPCSEILPEKNCRCLTTNEAWGSFEVDWNAWIDGQWLYPNEKPVAWMPFPEPYRGGKKE